MMADLDEISFKMGQMDGNIQTILTEMQEQRKELKETKNCIMQGCEQKRDTVFKAISHNQQQIGKLARQETQTHTLLKSHLKNHQMPSSANLSTKDRMKMHWRELLLAIGSSAGLIFTAWLNGLLGG